MVKLRLNQLGGQLGVGICLLGFVAIFLGWNGAASHGTIVQQFPYLISGGVSGLALIIVGASLIVVESQRAERVQLQATITQLQETLDRMAMARAAAGNGAAPSETAAAADAERAGLVVAGPSAYHRPTCRLVEGRGAMPTVTVDEARSRGLSPCRTCDAATVAAEAVLTPSSGRRRAARR